MTDIGDLVSDHFKQFEISNRDAIGRTVRRATLEALNFAQKVTPWVEGTLRSGYEVIPDNGTLNKQTEMAEIRNDIEYAEYVNDGTAKFEGRKMIEKTEAYARERLPEILDNEAAKIRGR